MDTGAPVLTEDVKALFAEFKGVATRLVASVEHEHEKVAALIYACSELRNVVDATAQWRHVHGPLALQSGLIETRTERANELAVLVQQREQADAAVFAALDALL